MGSLARLMELRATHLSLTPTALRAVLDGIAVRLDESREIARYFISLMIFLGLLGTFWGLLKTVGAVGGGGQRPVDDSRPNRTVRDV